MAKTFKREERYIVIKRKHLTNGHEAFIRGYLDQIGVGITECAVIEADGPEYETVWRMIEARVYASSPDAQCPQSPTGRHIVDTSMESGPNNCFHCDKPMENHDAS